MKVRIALALEPGLLELVDQTRGDVPRQRFIQRALEQQVGRIEYAPDYESAKSPKPSPKIGPPYRCPDNRCDRTFGSPQAKCPVHGRTAVPS